MKKLLTSICMVLMLTAASATEFTVHHAPGGPSDRATRSIAKYLPTHYVVVNRPGAGGRIAVRHILKTDSMMLATMGQIYVTNQISGVDTGYNTQTDLEIIGTAGAMPNVLACKKSLSVSRIKDLEGRSFNFGVAGYGSSEHLATEALLAKIKGNHQVIPYAQGGATGIIDMLAGNLDCMFANYPTIKPFVNDERIKLVMSSHDLGLDLPTWKDIYGENFPFQSYLSIIVGRNLDSDIKNRIRRDLNVVFENRQFREELKNIGLFVVAKTDTESTKQVERSLERLRNFIILSGIKVN
jgi:tripartite-type tricarboxylate transporter receptor subunit TctC